MCSQKYGKIKLEKVKDENKKLKKQKKQNCFKINVVVGNGPHKSLVRAFKKLRNSVCNTWIVSQFSANNKQITDKNKIV